jgi:hypothetical protein
VVPRYAGIAQDHDPALCGIAQDQNGIVREQLIKFWSHAYLKEQSIKNSFIGDFPNTTTAK